MSFLLSINFSMLILYNFFVSSTKQSKSSWINTNYSFTINLWILHYYLQEENIRMQNWWQFARNSSHIEAEDLNNLLLNKLSSIFVCIFLNITLFRLKKLNTHFSVPLTFDHAIYIDDPLKWSFYIFYCVILA